MVTSSTLESGVDRSNVASSGRGGRVGGGRSQGRGRGRSNGKIIPNAQIRKRRDEGITSNTSEKANGGRSNGGGHRHFSARGGGAGRGKSGGKGSASTSLDQPAVAEPSVDQEVKAMTDQVSCKQFAKPLISCDNLLMIQYCNFYPGRVDFVWDIRSKWRCRS